MTLALLAAAVYAGALALLTAGLGSSWGRRRLGAEARRKTLHVAMGLLAAPFPWVFGGPGPALALAAFASALLLAVRCWPWLAERWGTALHSVNRGSVGEWAFVCGVALSFLMARGTPWLHVVPVLLLALADTAAAVAGKRWGDVRWPWAPGTKTVAGSVAFAAVAFVLVAGALLLGGLPVSIALTTALGVAAFLALLEAAAGHGLDNLVVPVAASLLLGGLHAAPAYVVASFTGGTLLLAGALLGDARRADRSTVRS